MARGTEASLLVKAQASRGEDLTFDGSEIALPLLSESMQAKPTIYSSEALRNRPMRSRKLARLGTLDVSGGLELEATNHMLHQMLPLVFADAQDAAGWAGAADTYSRIYKPSTVDEQDYFTMSVSDGDIQKVYRDCRVNSMSVQANINQLARISLDTPGIRADVNGTPVNGAFPANEYGLYFEQAKVEFGNAEGVLAEIDAQTFSAQFSRNLNTGRYRLGNRFKRNLPGGLFDVTGSITVDANPLADKTALYNNVLQAQWMAIRLSFIDPSNQVDSDGAGLMVDSRFEISLPYVLIEWPQHNISGPDFLEGPVNFTAFGDEGALPQVSHTYSL